MICKIKRQLTAFFPVSKQREGECYNCGECCKLVFKCPFLKEATHGIFICNIYEYRFASCKKYPRHISEFKTQNTCGYKFKEIKKEKHNLSIRYNVAKHSLKKLIHLSFISNFIFTKKK